MVQKIKFPIINWVVNGGNHVEKFVPHRAGLGTTFVTKEISVNFDFAFGMATICARRGIQDRFSTKFNPAHVVAFYTEIALAILLQILFRASEMSCLDLGEQSFPQLTWPATGPFGLGSRGGGYGPGSGGISPSRS
jgi:hypothetical protein